MPSGPANDGPEASAAAPRPRAGRTGRFAPSPTGDLHAGSLVAALASRCDAPRWRVRIDDIDPPRAVPGSAERIVGALIAHGFPGAHAPPERQSAHGARYRRALDELCEAGHLFACACTRRTLAGAAGCTGGCRRDALAPAGLEALLGGGGPLDAPADGTAGRPAVRVRLGGVRRVEDRVLGAHRVDLDRLAPDVVVLRRDGLVAYHLATAVDDAHGIDDVVRGADLFDAAAVQGALIERLGRAAPRYAHVPVALDARGAKLAKSGGAAALDPARALESLHAAWRFLGQRPLPGPPPVPPPGGASPDADDPDGTTEALARFWDAARAGWSMARVPARRALGWPGATGVPDARG